MLLLVALVTAAPFFVFVVPLWTAPMPLNKPVKEITNGIGMKLVLIPATPPGKGFLRNTTPYERLGLIAPHRIVGGRTQAILSRDTYTC